MIEEEFYKELLKLGIELDENKKEKLLRYYELLIEWNNMMNLTAITDKKDVYLKHFYDSLTVYRDVDLTSNISICDVGTGAGFPGIVLKIVFPNLKITLIDSLNKRITFLNHVINELELTNIEARHDRMEDYSRKNIEKFDVIVSRAVASIPVISEISALALKIQGKLILMRGTFEEDANDLNKKLDKLALSVENIDRFLLPNENSTRTILSISKYNSTPRQYPRNIDKIKKNPL